MKMKDIAVYDDEEEEESALCFPGKRRKSSAKVVSDQNFDDFDEFDDDNEDATRFDLIRRQYTEEETDGNDEEIEDKYDYDHPEQRVPAKPVVYRPLKTGILTIAEEKLEARNRKKFDELEAKYNEIDAKAPPLLNGDVGELDTTGAVFVRINSRPVRHTNKSEYDFLVTFMYNCRQKRYLQLFNHPGDSRMGGVTSVSGKHLKGEDSNLAVEAIKMYHAVKGVEELKLVKLEKYNFVLWGRFIYYLTFLAKNVKTGEIKTYQAALAEHENEEDFYLGLFRNATDSKVLAILFVTGPKERYLFHEKHYWMGERFLKRKSRSAVDHVR